MAKEAKKEKKVILVDGRLINQNVFEKDQFNDKSTPSYKVEIAIPKANEAVVNMVCEELLAYADEKWGQGCGDLNIDGGNIISGILDGNNLARKREAKGKEGGAYKDTWVIRANTIYNKDGVDGPGGIQVWDEDVKPITIVNQGALWVGCQVQIAVTIHDYEDDDTGNHALKFYLSAVQKTGGDPEKDKLASAKDTSNLFKPVGRAAGAAAEGGRRRRPGT